MAEPLTLNEKIVGKLRAVRQLVRILVRFLLHPGDLIRLYHRDSSSSETLLEVSLLALEHDFEERLNALEARLARVEEQAAARTE